MASSQSTVDFILDQMGGAPVLSYKKMFGEYALYREDKLIALVCDDQLFVKPTEPGRAYLGTPDEAPPYPGAKNSFRIGGERWDDGAWMAELARLTARALPPPKPKKKK